MASSEFYREQDHWRILENRIRRWDHIRIPIRGDWDKALEDIEEAGKLLLSDPSGCFDLTEELITERSDLQRWIMALQHWQGETLKLFDGDLGRIRELSILLCRAMAKGECIYCQYEMESGENNPDPQPSAERDVATTQLASDVHANPIASPSGPAEKKQRLELIGLQFRIDDKIFTLKSDRQAHLLRALLDARGELRSGKLLDTPGVKTPRPDKIIEKLPDEIRAIIDSPRGTAGGYRIFPQYF